MHVNGTNDLCCHSRDSICSQLGDTLSSFRRHAPLTLALTNQYAGGFKDFLCFRKLDVTVRVPIALEAYPEQYVQDAYGNLMIIANGPLNLTGRLGC